MQILPYPFAKNLVEELLYRDDNSAEPASAEPEAKIEENHAPVHTFEEQHAAPPQSSFFHEEEALVHAGAPQREPAYAGGGQTRSNAPARPQQPVNVQPAVFSNFETTAVEEAEPNNLNMLLDIPLQVTVELGRTKRSVKDILELSTGSIIELDKLAGEPVDILVNNKLIAQGEVVVIDESFGVRVTDIVSQTDRIRKLR
jgi:flagellar motor switch protein FliN/FliY